MLTEQEMLLGRGASGREQEGEGTRGTALDMRFRRLGFFMMGLALRVVSGQSF